MTNRFLKVRYYRRALYLYWQLDSKAKLYQILVDDQIIGQTTDTSYYIYTSGRNRVCNYKILAYKNANINKVNLVGKIDKVHLIDEIDRNIESAKEPTNPNYSFAASIITNNGVRLTWNFNSPVASVSIYRNGRSIARNVVNDYYVDSKVEINKKYEYTLYGRAQEGVYFCKAPELTTTIVIPNNYIFDPALELNIIDNELSWNDLGVDSYTLSVYVITDNKMIKNYFDHVAIPNPIDYYDKISLPKPYKTEIVKGTRWVNNIIKSEYMIYSVEAIVPNHGSIRAVGKPEYHAKPISYIKVDNSYRYNNYIWLILIVVITFIIFMINKK